MLKRFNIFNYRSCLGTAVELHPNLSVFIGPNGSGKTNFLRAIMLLSKLAQEGAPILRGRGRGLGALSRLVAEFKLPRVQLNLSSVADVSTDNGNNDVLHWSRQHWSARERNGQTAEFVFPMSIADPGLNLEKYSVFLRYAGTEKHVISSPEVVTSWGLRSVASVAQFCRGITYYGASQFTNPSACPASIEIEEGDVRKHPVSTVLTVLS